MTKFAVIRTLTGATMLIAVLLAALALGSRPAVASAVIDGAVPQRYDLDVAWNPATRVLAGSSRITVENAGPAAVSRVWVRLWANGIVDDTTNDCAAAADRVTAVTGATVGGYRQTCSAVALDLPSALAPGAQTSFTVAFSVTVPDDATWTNQGVDDLGSVMPVVALHDDRGLHLEPYPATGEADYNVTADWHATVRVPDTLKAAMTGVESPTVAGGYRTYRSTAHVRDFAMVIGKLSTASSTVGGVTLRVVAGPGYQPPALSKALADLVRVFTSYQQWYGGYDLGDLDVVLGNYAYGGTEYPGIVLSNPNLQTIAHEVAHQWFYAIVGNDQYHDPWLDESFATWNELQFRAADYICDLAHPIGNSAKGLSTGMDWWGTHEDAYDEVIYGGGSCGLKLIEHEIGHDAFMTVLRNYVTDFHGRVARSDDFLDEVHRVAPTFDAARWASSVKLSP